MANNYTPAYRQYTQQSAGYTLPSSVRTYSVFDPASNSWRRMTNNGMSPMPQGNQPDIQAALAQARQTQGTVYPAQGMGQGQPVEVHPGYMNPPAQASAQMPSGGSVRPSPASGGGGAVLVQGQPSRASQRAVEAPTVVQTRNPYMGYAEIRKEYGDPEADVAFLNEQPKGVLVAGKVNTRGVGDVQSPFAAPVDVVAANRGLPPTGTKRIPHTQREFIEELAKQENVYPTEENVGAMLGTVATLGWTPYGLGVKGALGGVRQFNSPYVPSNFKALPKGTGAQPMGGGAKAPGSDTWTWKAKPNARRTYSQATRETQRPVNAEWVEVTPTGPVAVNGTPSRLALPTPTVNTTTGFGPIRTQANIPSGMPIRLGSYPELPPAGVGVQPMGRTASIIRSPMEMTTPSGLARWQYRLDQLSGLGR